MRQVTRREALKIMAGAAGCGLPYLGIGAPGLSPNSRANVAYIGIGGIAKGVLRQFPEDNHVALCDVDERSAAANRKQAPNAPYFKDFRRMFDALEKEIDAVVISTPDHTHFPAAMEAIERGKHVFVQKPLAHDIWQVRTLQKAAAKKGVITQMGNQGHAGEGIRRLKEWYEAGLCGEVREVVAWFSGLPNPDTRNWAALKAYPPIKSPVPAELDWDLWLGPTRERDYAEGFFAQGAWRAWWELGNGVLGDMGCHALDAPCWILDLQNPTSIVAEESEHHPEIVARRSKVVYQFPATATRPAVKVTWYNGQTPPELAQFEEDGIKVPQGNGLLLIGDKHSLYADAWCSNPMVLLAGEQWLKSDFRSTLPARSIPRVKGGPHREWLNHVKGIGPAPGSGFEYSAKLTEMILLGVLAQRAGQPVVWNGRSVTNAPALNRLLRAPVRKGWDYGQGHGDGGLDGI